MLFGSLKRHFGDELNNIVWLVLLYLIQGIPIGLSFGTIPFLLHKHATYTQIGIFTISTYPYSLKLLWSPIVDSYFIQSFGRRKSWIVPIQILAGIVFISISFFINDLLEHAETEVIHITIVFFLLIFLMATQDIAVDAWALTILSKPYLHYASTCQTIGLNTGYFLSYTIFLTLSSPTFANRYLRSIPSDQGMITLPGYLMFWGILFIILSIYLALFKDEESTTVSHQIIQDNNYDKNKLNNNNNNNNNDNNNIIENINEMKPMKSSSPSLLSSPVKKQKKNKQHISIGKQEITKENNTDDNDVNYNNNNDNDVSYDNGKKSIVQETYGMDINESDLTPKQVYKLLWKIITLPHIKMLSILFIISKIVFQPNESALNLKLLEKGLRKEDIASFSLIQFPSIIIFSILSSKWVKNKPLTIWSNAYLVGVFFILLNMCSVFYFPNLNGGEVSWSHFFLLLVITLFSSFSYNLMSVSQGSFFLKISDKSIGGTYVTLLNTIANFAGTYPKLFILMLIDKLTTSECIVKVSNSDNDSSLFSSSDLNLSQTTIQQVIIHDNISKELCIEQNGEYKIERDGYYIVATGAIIYGIFIYFVLKKHLVPIEKLKI
ncbi:hypothetical protein RB653_004843 [Dictyostelium firmibasis]|uniref:Acetyl-coenzyme A transporter 1 n=1 Tax=Dictyostelium firmibasis TaxID=79012 RepID=A0AAN7Z0H1_9MYCE